MSAFLLFYRLLLGQDIRPQLNEYVLEYGANVLRTFLCLGWDNLSPRFFPSNFPNYWEKWEEYVSLCAEYGVRIEWTMGDLQIVFPTTAPSAYATESAVQVFVDEHDRHCEGKWNTFRETINEPFKNGLPDPLRIHVRAIEGSPRASGKYDLPDATIGAPGPPMTLPHLDYVTIHSERKDEWVRLGKDLQEIREGWAAGVNSAGQPFRALEGVHCPVVSDEPMGAAEENSPGRRSNVPSDFRDFAAGCLLMGTGATFHSEDSMYGNPLGPNQRECAFQFFLPFLYIPPEAQTAPYQRGDQNSEVGVGNMPIMHDDRREVRSFCKPINGVEYCVQMRTNREHATPRDGWQVVKEPAKGLVILQR